MRKVCEQNSVNSKLKPYIPCFPEDFCLSPCLEPCSVLAECPVHCRCLCPAAPNEPALLHWRSQEGRFLGRGSLGSLRGVWLCDSVCVFPVQHPGDKISRWIARLAGESREHLLLPHPPCTALPVRIRHQQLPRWARDRSRHGQAGRTQRGAEAAVSVR